MNSRKVSDSAVKFSVKVTLYLAAILEFEEVHFITSDKMYVEDGNEGEVKCGAQGSPKPEVCKSSRYFAILQQLGPSYFLLSNT